MPLLAWLESTALARAVGESLPVTAALSSVHLIGFTLVMGGALLFNLRVLKVLLPQHPLDEVVAPAAGAIYLGLSISIVTGFLLFSARAGAVVANGSFRLKILLLIAAVALQLTLRRRLGRPAGAGAGWVRPAALGGVILWLGLAVTACWFILFE